MGIKANDSGEREYSTSVVRLAFLPDHRDKIGVSEQWYQVMDTIRHQPNFGFICKGESVDDELDVVLFIGWENAAKPPASFLSGNLDCIFSPLDAFVVRKPQLMCNLYQMMRGPRHPKSWNTSTMSLAFISEFIIIRGPAHATEKAVKEIEMNIDVYHDNRIFVADWYSDWLLMRAFFFRVGEDSEKRPDAASFLLNVAWKGLEERREYKDPTIPDRSLLPEARQMFPSDFWQKSVVERLESLGATTSSWTYHKAEAVRNKEGRLVVGG
ncbi:hypothetical protein J3E69DRAFT_338290 [Trichoderma sp. SZMC 28015]|uniref:Uncharacterized protein n=1 Tax=Trichoderma lentiforme TaxID=1567552 RepID=A0A9P5CDA5_9HYPO|nr:hypothetical protein CFAM422_004772 [Trichoderma lentiforme]